MQGGPDAGCLPRAQPSPTRLTAAANIGKRQMLSLHAGAQHEDHARQRRTIQDVWPTTFKLHRLVWQERLDYRPEVAKYESIHICPKRSLRFCPTL